MIYRYLLEIKYRTFFSFVAWSFIMINCYYFKETLLYIFMRFSSKSNDNDLIFFLTTDIAEVFIAYISLSFYISNQITIIFSYCQIFCFLSTGLYLFEYLYFKTILIVLIICWITSIFMLNKYIFPASWDFFLKFQDYLAFQNITFYFEVKLSEYLIFYESMYYLCNITCQIVLLFFILLDLFKTSLLVIKKLRKLFYFIFFLFSTLLTPPDIISQIIAGICTILIYELVTVHLIIKNEFSNFT